MIRGAQVVFSAGDRRLIVEVAGSGRRVIEVRAEALILATGARERFLPFPGWTLPNVIGVGAAQALLKSGATFRGRRAVIAGTGPLLLPAAAGLASHGARVAAVAEQAPSSSVRAFALGLVGSPRKLLDAALYRARFPRARYRTGVWVLAADGRDTVREATLTDGSRCWTEACDLLCCAYGLVPNLELPVHLGCEIQGDRVLVDDLQRTNVPALFCAGELTGIGGVELALVEGEIAGLASAERTEEARKLQGRRSRLSDFASALERTFALREELRRLPRAETLVCRCEDVALGRLRAEWSRREAKLYTRVGMGPCQGKVCGPALEFLFGWEADAVRMPIRPASLSSFLSMAQGSEPRNEERMDAG